MYKKLSSILKFLYLLIARLTYKSFIQKHIENLINRLSEFQNKLVITDSLEFKKLLGNNMLELLAVL
jgi:tRNA uridine 5-carbamoylmethylation protein Kti12